MVAAVAVAVVFVARPPEIIAWRVIVETTAAIVGIALAGRPGPSSDDGRWRVLH